MYRVMGGSIVGIGWMESKMGKEVLCLKMGLWDRECGKMGKELSGWMIILLVIHNYLLIENHFL